MRVKKIILYVLAVMLIAVLPMTVSAVGEDGSEPSVGSTAPYSLTFECKVNGSVPENTEFVFEVKTAKITVDDDDNLKLTDEKALNNFVINTKSNTDGKARYDFGTSTVGNYYSFKLVKCSDKLAVIGSLEVQVSFYNAESIKTEVLKNGHPDEELTSINEPAVVPVFLTKATEVKISTDGCEAVSKVYDGKVNAAVTDKNYKLGNIVEGHDVKLSFEKADFNSPDVKSASKVTVSGLKLTGADADKYALTVDKFTCRGSVTPRPLTVTADNLVTNVGQPEPALTYKLSEELIEGNQPVGALARAAGDTVGEYAVTRGTLSFGDNYEINFVNGSLIISDYSYTQVTNSATSITISGYFDPAATVNVALLDPQSNVYSALAAGTSWGQIVSSYTITFSANADGELTVSFPVDKKYEGKPFAVYQQMPNGSIACYKTTASDGVVTVKTDQCTQFMLVTEKDAKKADDGPSVAMTILKVMIIILSVIVGLGLLTALFFFGMIFFNKTEQLKKIIITIKRLFKK